jgi:hypothetical protein
VCWLIISTGGDGINRATAYGRDESNNTPHHWRSAHPDWAVVWWILTVIIIGKVHHDINRDGIQQKRRRWTWCGRRTYLYGKTVTLSWPILKVNIILYGVSAKTHVLKAGLHFTIPRQSGACGIQSNRNTGDAGSRFVDLKYGELHRAADSAIVGGMADSTERLNAEPIARSKNISVKNNNLEQAVKSKLDLEPIYERDS